MVPRNHGLDGVEISPLEWAVLGVGWPNEKHWESLLRCMWQKGLMLYVEQIFDYILFLTFYCVEPVALALDLEDYRPSVLLHCWLGHPTCKIVSEMTHNVSSGTLNLQYHTILPFVKILRPLVLFEIWALMPTVDIYVSTHPALIHPTIYVYWIHRSPPTARRKYPQGCTKKQPLGTVSQKCHTGDVFGSSLILLQIYHSAWQ